MQYDDDEADDHEAYEAGDHDQSEGVRRVYEQLERPVARRRLRREHDQLRVGDYRSPHADRTLTVYRVSRCETLHVVVGSANAQIGVGCLQRQVGRGLSELGSHDYELLVVEVSDDEPVGGAGYGVPVDADRVGHHEGLHEERVLHVVVVNADYLLHHRRLTLQQYVHAPVLVDVNESRQHDVLPAKPLQIILLCLLLKDTSVGLCFNLCECAATYELPQLL